MFAFYAIGLLLLSVNFIGLYAYALRKKLELTLTPIEQFDTQSGIVIWFAAAIIGLVSFTLAIFIPIYYIGYSGYIFFVLVPVLKWLGHSRKRNRKLIIARMMAVNSHET